MVTIDGCHVLVRVGVGVTIELVVGTTRVRLSPSDARELSGRLADVANICDVRDSGTHGAGGYAVDDTDLSPDGRKHGGGEG